MRFRFSRLRFEFQAQSAIHFAPGKAGNMLRGALGYTFRQVACRPACHDARECPDREQCAYARIFEPISLGAGPSGLADWPRPFVFRASHLDGRTVQGGTFFHFDIHLFEIRNPVAPYFERAFSQLGRQGLGPTHSPAVLTGMSEVPVEVRLDPLLEPIKCVRILFRTPAELKHGEQLASRPEFGILLRRIRDRLNTLSELYGEGPLSIDFAEFGRRADSVVMTRCELRNIEVSRLSSRTGQRHSLGGFAGIAEYEGELSEFLPFLQAAQFTGVGRQTTWGKGEIVVTTPLDDSCGPK
jgi:hypothetical protein